MSEEKTDRLYYFSKSKDKIPGEGVHERVKNLDMYSHLSKIKNWRQILSNFYMLSFIIDNKRWLTVEHYYQGSKFCESFMHEFSIDSESEISKLPELAKAAGGKSGKFKGKTLRPSHIECKIEEFNKKREAIMYKAMFAKFSQNSHALTVLLNTKDAELWHGTRGVPPKRVYVLESLRNILKEHKISTEVIKKIKIQLRKKIKIELKKNQNTT